MSRPASEVVPDPGDADEDLMHAFYADGRDEALERLITRYRWLEHLVFINLPFQTRARREKAEEIVWTMWGKVMNTRSSGVGRWLPERGPVRRWLLAIVDNCRLDEVRKEARAPVSYEQLPDVADQRQEGLLHQCEGAVAMAGWLAKLERKHQNVVILKYWEGCSQVDIGRILGVSEATISRWHTEALDGLRAHIRGG